MHINTLKQACFHGYPESAIYVQILIGSRNSAIHNDYHTSLSCKRTSRNALPGLLRTHFIVNALRKTPPKTNLATVQ